MKATIELTNQEVEDLIVNALKLKLFGDLNRNNVVIMVKTKYNYKAEWERGEFKVSYMGEV